MNARDPNDYFPQDDLDAPAASPARAGKDGYVPPEKMFSEGCTRCRGTGNFISYSGRVLGPCFACKGKGKFEYKTSPEARAKAQGRSAAKRESKAADDRAWQADHADVIAWLRAAALANSQRNGTFTFPSDLIAKLHQYGTLTDGQLAAVRKLMHRDAQRAAARVVERAEREASAPAVDASKISQAFAVAREHAARPGQLGVYTKPIRMQSGDVTVVWTPGSIGSQWEGMLFAKTPEGKKLGAVKDGKFNARFTCTPVEAAAVLDCAQNPELAAVAYGKAWSRCGICDRTLHNDESIARGIGPICAERFGW